MDSTTSSPVITHFGETLSGATTIRAYQKEDFYISQCNERINTNIKASFWLAGLNRWFSIRLTLVSMVVTSSSMVALIVFRDSVDPVKLGLLLSYIIWI